MFMTLSDERTANPELADKIEQVYKAHFRVKQRYTCRMEYRNALDYGFVNWQYREWKQKRVMNAQEYISYIGTHCEHITLEEPYRSEFYEGIRKVILEAGNQIVILDTIPLYSVQKPL